MNRPLQSPISETVKILLQNGALLLLVTAFLYFMGYKFEQGYLAYFNVQNTDIVVNPASYINMLTSTGALYAAGTYLLSYKNDHLKYSSDSNKSKKHKFRFWLIQALPIVVLSLLWLLIDMCFSKEHSLGHSLSQVWNSYLVYFSLLALIILSLSLVPSSFKSLLAYPEKNRAMHFFSEGVVLMVIIAGVMSGAGLLAEQLGRNEAHIQHSWQQIDYAGKKILIVKDYPAYMIGVQQCNEAKVSRSTHLLIYKEKTMQVRQVQANFGDNIFC